MCEVVSALVKDGVEVRTVLTDAAEEFVTALTFAQAKMKRSSRSEVKPMAVRQPRYGKEEFAQRGDVLYESQVRSQVEAGNHGKIVAIDIETGAFEVADDLLAASKRLLVRFPDAQTWFVRIGHSAVDHFSARSLRPQR